MENSAHLKLAMLFQLGTRLLTFLMNNLIARSTSATNLGLITLKLDLLGNTVMALGRDGIRMAALREKSQEERVKGKLLTPILVAIIGFISSILFLKTVKDPIIIEHYDEFRTAVVFYLLAVIMESLTESSTVDLIVSQKFKKKIAIESMSLIIKIAFILWRIIRKSNGEDELSVLLMAFSKGQLIYAICLNLLHFTFGSLMYSSYFVLPSQKFFNLASALTRQNFFKYFLAQGDLFIISSFSTLKDQGIYAVVSNYGSLVLRLVMQPIEEASLQYFSQVKDDKNVKKEKVLEYFNMMLKSLTYLGLVFICFGSFFTDPLIHCLLGRKWSKDTSVADALSAYCWLVATAAVSGFLESFVNAVIEEDGMRKLRWISIACSIGYCIVAVSLISLKGSVGLISASAVNFAVRAAANATIIQEYWTKKERLSMNQIWRDSVVPGDVFGFFGVAFVINFGLFLLRRREWKLRISIGILLFSISITLILKTDKKFTRKFLRHWLNK